MLWATNSVSQLVAENAMVSFDTVVCNTNGNVTLDDDTISIHQPGWYVVSMRGLFTNSSTSASAQVGVRLLANEDTVLGSEMIWDVPASGELPAFVSVPVHVLPAESGIAKLSWQATDQVSLDDVMLTVERKI